MWPGTLSASPPPASSPLLSHPGTASLMTRPAAFAALALSFALFAPLPPALAPVGIAHAAGIEALDPPVPPESPRLARKVATRPVTPRSFNFGDLPRRPPSENLPITLRREHEWKELAEIVEK